VRLATMRLRGGWRTLGTRIRRWATSARSNEWLEVGDFAVLADDGATALRYASQHGLINTGLILASGDAAMERRLVIFGTSLPKSEQWPWHEDWRFSHQWVPKYFRDYDHSVSRSDAYDVKFPWELSRLAFLVSLAQADAIDGSSVRISKAFEILADWTKRNPLAYSVNWYPMEAAIRGINLCMFSDIVRQVGVDNSQAQLLLQTLAEHGEFIERTLEITDDAGNHLTAELVALLLIGRTLCGFYDRAKKWHRMAADKLGPEILRQILPDGVNFEKSTAYHGLVLDLFILGSVSLGRTSPSISEIAHNRLRNAAHYSAWFQRPDNVIPIVGDTDDASVFPFDHREIRDRRPSLGVAAVFFDDAKLKRAAESISNAAIWLFGRTVFPRWDDLDRIDQPITGHRLFADGGIFIARSRENYLFVDVGEVGQNGLGGHGHNDILSFELFLGGEPVVVDPGTYLYSGDFETHARLRSTQSHNGLQVDGTEIAPLIGNFRIGDRAMPTEARTGTTSGGVVSIDAGHTGYMTLTDPVLHERQLSFDADKGSLHCRDRISASGKHTITRFLHFAAHLNPELHNNEIRIETPTNTIIINWTEDCQATLRDDHVCPGFGRIEPARTLIIRKEINGNTVLGLDLYRLPAGPIVSDVPIA